MAQIILKKFALFALFFAGKKKYEVMRVYTYFSRSVHHFRSDLVLEIYSSNN